MYLTPRKKLIKFFKILSLVTAIFFLAIGVLVSVLQLSFPLIIRHYKTELETYASQKLQQPIQIANIATAWHRFTLIVKLQDVLLINPQDNQSSLRIQEVKVGINPWLAIINHQYWPSLLTLQGAHLNLHQRPDNSIEVEGVHLPSRQPATKSPLEEIAGLLAIRHLVLQDVDIEWFDKKGEHYAIDNINMEMLNNKNRHRLWGKLTAVNHQQLAENDTTQKLRNARLNLKTLAPKDPLAIPVLRSRITNGQYKLTATSSQMSLSKEPLLNISDAISIRSAAIPLNLSFSFNIQGDWHTIESLKSKTYLKVENLALSQWSKQFTFLPLHDNQGLVNAEVWADWHAYQLQQLKSVFNVEKFHLHKNQTILGLQAAKGNLVWLHEPNIHVCPKIQYLGVEKQPICFHSNNQVALAMEGKGMQFNHKNLFAKPIRIDRFQTHLQWRQQAEQAQLKINDVSASLQTMKLQGQMQLTNLFHNPEIRLLAGITGADAKYLPDYLPVGILKPSLTHWLLTAIKSGHSPYGTVVLHGPLANYPFINHEGAFVIHANVRDANLEYMPGWPMLNNINGQLTFDKHHMLISTSGDTLGAQVKKAEAIIEDLTAKNTILHINSTIDATLAQGQEFINTSPLQHSLGKAFAEMKMDGPIALNLGLTIPLKKEEGKIQVKGDLALNNTRLDLIKWQLPLQNFTGLLHFTEHTVTGENLHASLFEEPLLINMRTVNVQTADPITEVEIQSKVTSNLLKQHLKLPTLTWLKGATTYTAVLQLHHAHNRNNNLKVSSNLRGMTIDLPQPLGKLANASIPSQLNVEFLKTGQLDFKVDYGKELMALLNFQKRKDKLLFQEANIKVNNPMVSGEIRVPSNNQEIQAKLQHLYLTPSNEKNNMLDKIEASDLPPLNIMINDFRYGSKRLGRTHLMTAPTDDGLDITKLSVDVGPLLLNAKGHWTDTDKMEKTELRGKIISNNVASALTAIGVPQLITANTGMMDFSLSWPGSPTDFKLADLNGAVKLQLAHGSIVDIGRTAAIKMNLGRMLNLLSLESFPTYLNFKFHNVTFRGFDFKSVQGDFNIRDGQSYTENTQVRGPMAAIDMKGRLGLANQDYDMYITVAPHLATGLPLVATLMGGPLAGAIAWVADKVLSKGTEKIMTHTYHMTGSWKSPAVEKMSTTNQRSDNGEMEDDD